MRAESHSSLPAQDRARALDLLLKLVKKSPRDPVVLYDLALVWEKIPNPDRAISLLPFVSWAGHLGGFVFGLPCGLALRAGPRTFPYLAPILLFVSAAAAVAAAHPMR